MTGGRDNSMSARRILVAGLGAAVERQVEAAGELIHTGRCAGGATCAGCAPTGLPACCQTEVVVDSASDLDEMLNRVSYQTSVEAPYHVLLLPAVMPEGKGAMEVSSACWAMDPRLSVMVLDEGGDESPQALVAGSGDECRGMVRMRRPVHGPALAQAICALAHLSEARRQVERDRLRIDAEAARRAADAAQAAADLASAREAGAAAERVKTQFLANLSHEVRTPLNGIIGMADLLLETVGEGDLTQSLRAIRQSGIALLGLFNDMMDFCRLETGGFQLRRAPLDLAGTVAGVREVFASDALAKKIDLIVTMTCGVPADLVGDTGAIRQILTKLVGNAIKFTRVGRVQVTVACPQVDRHEALLRIDVQDTGIGVAPEHLERMFAPFEQADGSATRLFGGIGLGLPICRKLARLMGGDITVVSAPGAGSTVTFHARLPRRSAAGAPAPAAGPATPAVEGTPAPSILLVEDSDISRVVVSRMLQRLHCRVDTATTAAEAGARLRGDTYDLILMDVQLPDGNGIEIARDFRRTEGSQRRTPVLALTASDSTAAESECLAAGMDSVLLKPVTLDDLRRVLRQRVPRWGAPAGASNQHSPVNQPATGPDAGADQESLPCACS